MSTPTDSLMFPDPATLSETQRERRQRILAAAEVLASRGGFDGVQMRTVAEHADVALGTLYRYFASKVHLLVTLTYERAVQFLQQIHREPPPEEDPVERVLSVLTQVTRVLQAEPSLTEAMLRAIMVADSSANEAVERANDKVTEILIRTYRGAGGEADEEDAARARVLEMVWMTSLLAWLSGRASAEEVDENLGMATRLILRE